MLPTMRQFDRQYATRTTCVGSRLPARLGRFSNLQPSTLNPRAAFTLIEMLVAVSILVILATLAVGAFSANNNDRATASANIFKTAIEGARSRAIRSKQVRGLRLLTDPNDPRIVTSLQYLGAPAYDEGTCSLACSGGGVWTVTRTSITGPTWDALKGTPGASGNLLQIGNRIEIPANSGHWYTTTMPFNFANEELTLAGHYSPSQFSGGTFVAIPATNVSYRLELSPAPLPDDPIPLSAGTCIDLDGCQLPDAWRIREDKNRNGVLEPALTPPFDEPDNGSGKFEFSIGYNQMDVLFSPNGRLIGDAASQGMIHFHVCYVSDAFLAQTEDIRSIALAASFPVPPSDPDSTYAKYIVPAVTEKDRRAVSLFTRTGTIVISEIFATEVERNSVANSTTAFNPFRFATQGKDN